MTNSCQIGYIYCLYVDNIIVYIGQTKRLPKERFRLHKYTCFDSKRQDKRIYEYIKSIGITKDDFSSRVIYKTLMVSPINNLDINEMKYIKHCINKDKIIYNNCVKTNSYRLLKNKELIF